MKVTVKVTKKQIFILAIFSIIIFIFFLSISILHSKGLYTVQYSGFGIDFHGTLYVGTDLGIKKYQNDIESGNINPQTSRGYSFTMQNNDTILLSVSDEFITMDLDGNVLSRKDYNGDYNLKSEIEKSRRSFEDQKGSIYTVKLPFLRTTVYNQNDEVIFQMPELDYSIRIMTIFVFIIMFVFIPCFVIKAIFAQRKKPDNYADVSGR